MPRVTILLAVSLMLLIGCSPDDDTGAAAVATATKAEAVTTPAPAKPEPPTDPLVRALSGEPVATCGVPRTRPLWRHAITSVANGLGLDSDTRLAVYKALPSGVSRFLRR